MEAVLGIVFFAGLVAVVMLLNKAKDAASRALTQKVIYRKKFEQGKHILKGFTFETTTSPSNVMQQLERRVVAAEAPSGLTARLYVALRRPARIDYVYGNKFSESFRVAIVLESRESGTLGVLKPIRWHEHEGIIVAQEWMGQLLDQVRTAVGELDASASFVEGVHDSVQLTAPAEEAASESDAWPEPESEPEAEPARVASAPLAAPAAVATAVPVAPPASYSGDITPIVPPTKANATVQWVGIAMVAGAMLWIGVLGVRVSTIPLWFAVFAGGGAIIYFADRAARKGRAPATVPDAAPVLAETPHEAETLAEETAEPTPAERLATDESEPDPYAWTEPKVAPPGSAPVTLNSALGGLWNIVVGVALLGLGGWSLLTGALEVFSSLLMIAGGGYFLASRSFEGRVAVFVHRIAEWVAGRLLAVAATVSGRLDSAGKSVKPVVLGRCVLATVAIVGLGYGIKGLSGVGDVMITVAGDGSVSTSSASGSPLAWIALLVGVSVLWVWPAMEKLAALGTTTAPASAAQPKKTAAVIPPAMPIAEETTPAEPLFFEEAAAGPVEEPSPEESEAPVTADALAGGGFSASNRRLVLVGGAVAAVLVAGVVIVGVVSTARDRSAPAEAAQPATQESGSAEVNSEPDDSPAEFDFSPDQLLGYAGEGGEPQYVDIAYAGGSEWYGGDALLNFVATGLDDDPEFLIELPNSTPCFIDSRRVAFTEYWQAASGPGMIVFDCDAVRELHVFTQGQSASARVAGGESAPGADIASAEGDTASFVHFVQDEGGKVLINAEPDGERVYSRPSIIAVRSSEPFFEWAIPLSDSYEYTIGDRGVTGYELFEYISEQGLVRIDVVCDDGKILSINCWEE